MTSTQDVFLPARDIRARYNVSSMTLHRWLRDPQLEFPKPIVINRRRYWALRDLVRWERSRCGKSIADIDLATEQRAARDANYASPQDQ